MAAVLIIHTKEIREDEIVEIKVWRIPRTENTPDGVKISVTYVKNGRRIVGYDNSEGKGYHRHLMNREEKYAFLDVRTLLSDFKRDVRAIRGRDWDENEKNTH